MTRAQAAIVTLLALWIGAPAALGETAAAMGARTVSAKRLPDIPVLSPDTTPRGLVLLVSGSEGWTAERAAEASSLVAAGLIVLPVDFTHYRKALAASGDGCHYVVADIEELAQRAERELGLTTYLRPIVVGSGTGAGTFAYAALADAPDNTLGGAVAVGFDNRLDTPVAFCRGASSRPHPKGGFSYAFDSRIPAAMTFLVESGQAEGVPPRFAAGKGVTLIPLDPAQRIPQLVKAVIDVANGDSLKAAALPIARLDPKDHPQAIAVIWSGDGGWRDIDRRVGELLAREGFAVAGVDALRYFWSERTPQEMARDMAIIIDALDPAGRLPILLAGYSFGANVLPFAWPLLAPAIQERTRLLAILAPEPKTGFQISVVGWLGLASGKADVVAALTRLPQESLLCVTGKDEKSSGCDPRRLDPRAILSLPGGHHFNNDYATLTARILAAFQARNARH